MPASFHVNAVMQHIRDRLQSLDQLFSNLRVEVANPARFMPLTVDATKLVTLFLYRIEPDRAAMHVTPDGAMAVGLNVMITAFCQESDNDQFSADSEELNILSQIMSIFIQEPEFGPIPVAGLAPIGPLSRLAHPGVMVSANQLSPDMEQINHIWSTQGPNVPFRTSLIYRFHCAIVAATTASQDGPIVLRGELRNPDPENTMPVGPIDAAPTPVPAAFLGSLQFVIIEGASRHLLPSLSVVDPSDPVDVELLLIAERAVNYQIEVERFDAATQSWEATQSVPAANPSATIRDFDPLFIPTGVVAQISVPTATTVYRIRADNLDDDAVDFSMAYLTIEVTE